MSDFFVGTGYDIHKLVEGRKLTLAGVEIPFERGSLGHSDGDALSHAICDALLGAAALGDIGRHFPDNDPQYRGAASLSLLAAVVQLLDKRGFKVQNVDATVIIERPKLAPYISEMISNLANVLNLAVDSVSVKAKSNEGLGEIGRGEAAAAQAVCLLRKTRTESS
ncbi:MAG TPA: 2-C-methyl-D-erythritol 2,4-cyclodiphosphate synthase [Blastocatellia bacterium]|nr:2-C-methyl-D-erythritol 2,4-cyclodiphosphate synthase [Blastocatellia bacterium]